MSSPSPLRRPSGGDTDTGPNLEAAALTTILVAAIVVAARLYARATVVKSVGWDDWLMLFALALGIVSTATEFVATEHGFGRHLYYVSSSSVVVIGKYLSLSGAFCNLSLMFAKLSIISTVLRVLHGSGERAWMCFLWLFAFTILGVNTMVTGTQFGQCTPAHKLWDRGTPGHCWDPKIQRDLSYLQGAYSAFTDFALSGLPLIVFRHVRMSRASRNALFVVMSLGLVTGALAIARTVETWRYSGIDDSTRTSVTLLMLSALERNFAITLASLPPCAKLIRGHWRFVTLHSLRSRLSGFTSSASGSRRGTLASNQDTSAEGEKAGRSLMTAEESV